MPVSVRPSTRLSTKQSKERQLHYKSPANKHKSNKHSKHLKSGKAPVHPPALNSPSLEQLYLRTESQLAAIVALQRKLKESRRVINDLLQKVTTLERDNEDLQERVYWRGDKPYYPTSPGYIPLWSDDEGNF